MAWRVFNWLLMEWWGGGMVAGCVSQGRMIPQGLLRGSCLAAKCGDMPCLGGEPKSPEAWLYKCTWRVHKQKKKRPRAFLLRVLPPGIEPGSKV